MPLEDFDTRCRQCGARNKVGLSSWQNRLAWLSQGRKAYVRIAFPQLPQRGNCIKATWAISPFDEIVPRSRCRLRGVQSITSRQSRRDCIPTGYFRSVVYGHQLFQLKQVLENKILRKHLGAMGDDRDSDKTEFAIEEACTSEKDDENYGDNCKTEAEAESVQTDC